MDNPYRLFVYLIPYSTLMSAPEGPCQGAPMSCFSPLSLSLGPGCSAILFSPLTSLAQSISLKG
jgi:hypothetical protein